MVLTDFGMKTDFSDVFANAPAPTSVTVEGISMDVIPVLKKETGMMPTTIKLKRMITVRGFSLYMRS